MFSKYIKDLINFFGSIFHSNFADPNIIFYYVYTQLVCLKRGICSKYLYTSYFFLTYWLKPNCVFPIGQLLVLLPQSQVLDSNSQYRIDNNNHFTVEKREKTRCMGLLTKAVGICIRKKISYYYQNNDHDGKSLLVGLNQ